ncbi:uncharacterized protein MONBRDRAFT_29905 [Monosiga brevicollis MX1]|uniref:DNA mismatch repair proteins mutS family domain-containing protein n=1 Tax=Monosiga brevicollis TaxID=81824 RepID=A9VCG8_MONBE|nr:uncharacterized protein MONBRDRAFT_29905 [Monosiga brevicollis MX1]EDQ84782.1 predicted protein [Monosiga brevicollis MX1]|eukprot:XP_001750432.1 hypothetical protein [Monosiga brevicollis MX1]
MAVRRGTWQRLWRGVRGVAVRSTSLISQRAQQMSTKAAELKQTAARHRVSHIANLTASLREAYPAELILCQNGSFFEITGDDIQRLQAQSVPLRVSNNLLAGFPHTALENWLLPLAEAFDFRIVIVEQATRKATDKVVPRVVTRVISPGTRSPDLDCSECHLVATAFDPNSNLIGVARVDLTAGQITTALTSRSDVDDILAVHPADEILIPTTHTEVVRPLNTVTPSSDPNIDPSTSWFPQIRPSESSAYTAVPMSYLTYKDDAKLIQKLTPPFAHEMERHAVAVLLNYLKRAYGGDLPSILQSGSDPLQKRETVHMSKATRLALELTQGRESSHRLASTLTKAPLENGAASTLQGSLKLLRDPRINLSRKSNDKRRMGVLDLAELLASLRKVLIEALEDFDHPTSHLWQKEGRAILQSPLAESLLGMCIGPDNLLLGPLDLIPPGYSTDVDAARRQYETDMSKATRIIDELMSVTPAGFLDLNGQLYGRCAYPILTSIISLLPAHSSRSFQAKAANLQAHDFWDDDGAGLIISGVGARKFMTAHKLIARSSKLQTKTKAKGSATQELLKHSALATQSQSLLELKQMAELLAVYERVVEDIALVNRIVSLQADIDVTCALAMVAREQDYVRPKIVAKPILEIEGGRHPVVEAIGAASMRYTPNDCHIPAGGLQILTGPNMGGKSTYLRQVALAVIMAQMGSFVAADSMTYGIVDQIFTRIGADDSLEEGMSTFMVEMSDLAAVLSKSTSNSLVILDEIGRGTSPHDGLAIALSALQHIHDVKANRTLVVTHYHDLPHLTKDWPNVQLKHMRCIVTEDEVLYDHELHDGHTDLSYGIEMARHLLPSDVIGTAEAIRATLTEHGYLTLTEEGTARLNQLARSSRSEQQCYSEQDVKG